MNKRKRREDILKTKVNLQDKKILEIGALNYPTFFKEDYDVYYLDWFSNEELEEKYPHRRKGSVKIDYVIKSTDYAGTIKEKFDLIIANHVIEHIPNPIQWFKQIERLMNDDGFIFLSVPDRRCTFDYLRAETQIKDLIDRFQRDVSRPEVKDVFDQIFWHRPVKNDDYWQGRIKQKLNKRRFSNALEAWNTAEKKVEEQGYVDIHCNVFTGESFQSLINHLFEAKLINFKIHHFADIQEPLKEFNVVLKLVR